MANAISAGTADIGLTYDIYIDNDIEHQLITQLRPFAVMSSKNPLAKRKKLSLRDLADEPLIMQDSPGFREYFFAYFGLYGLKPQVLHRPTTYEMVRGLLAAGNGYSFALVKIKNTRSYDGAPLANVELVEAPPRVNLVVATLKGYRQSRMAEAFTAECKQCLRDIATGGRVSGDVAR